MGQLELWLIYLHIHINSSRNISWKRQKIENFISCLFFYPIDIKFSLICLKMCALSIEIKSWTRFILLKAFPWKCYSHWNDIVKHHIPQVTSQKKFDRASHTLIKYIEFHLCNWATLFAEKLFLSEGYFHGSAIMTSQRTQKVCPSREHDRHLWGSCLPLWWYMTNTTSVAILWKAFYEYF